jgi:TolB protein
VIPTRLLPVLRALSLTLISLMVLSLGLRGPLGHAQEATKTDFIIEVNKPGNRDVPIAIPKPTGGSAMVDTVWEVVRHDLEMSGYFKVLNPDAFIEPASAGLEPGQFKFEDWDVPDAVVLGKTKVESVGDKVRAEVWVYDVPGRRKLGAKAFTGDPNQARRMGHRIADEIILQVTGEPGIFNTRFAVVTQRSGNKEIALVDVDGEGFTSITQNGSINLQPAWSKDGSKIAFTSYRSGNPDIYIADLARGRTTRLSARPGVNIGAAWHPAGDRLAVTLSSNGSGDTDLFMLEAETGRNLGQLTNASGIDVSPAFSPDGGQVAFASERSGGVQIYVMSASGGDARRVTFNGGHNTDPAWSPKGDKIAYVSRDGVFDVFTVGTDGKGAVRITQGQGDNEDPTWSPDGRYLAFSSTRSGGNHIWMSTADGRHQVQATKGKGGYSNPSWSPRLSW